MRRIIPWLICLGLLAGCGDSSSTTHASTNIDLTGPINAVIGETTCNPLRAGELALLSNITVSDQQYTFGVVVLNAAGGGTFTGKQVNGILDGVPTNKGGEVTWLSQAAPASTSQSITASSDLKSGMLDLTLVNKGKTTTTTEHAKGTWACA